MSNWFLIRPKSRGQRSLSENFLLSCDKRQIVFKNFKCHKRVDEKFSIKISLLFSTMSFIDFVSRPNCHHRTRGIREREETIKRRKASPQLLS